LLIDHHSPERYFVPPSSNPYEMRRPETALFGVDGKRLVARREEKREPPIGTCRSEKLPTDVAEALGKDP
jgi:hypothetical protein